MNGLKLLLVLLCVVSPILSSCGADEENREADRVLKDFPSDETLMPPNVKLTAEGQTVPFVRGTYSWSVDGMHVTADSVAPPELVTRLTPVVVTPESKLTVAFETEPISFSASLWVDKRSIRQPVMEETILLPKDAGIYVYELHARWTEGDAHYAFTIEVR